MLNGYLQMLPPKSFTQLYNQFIATAQSWGRGYDKEKLENYIQRILSNLHEANLVNEKIDTLDEIAKKSPDIEQLVIDRKKAEVEKVKMDDDLINLSNQIYKYDHGLKRLMNQYEELTNKTERGKHYDDLISIMNNVLDYFTNKINTESERYSVKLQSNIQSLFDKMSTTKRNVNVTNDFAVSVYDSFKDESKSEGQFAVVSFAYIGGILQMLKGEPQLVNKEYPLILDGPFSKLDPDQKQNVIDNISDFANQVILFSKEDLHPNFDDEMIGKVWTIESNDEKNVASIKEGHLWK